VTLKGEVAIGVSGQRSQTVKGPDIDGV